MSLLDNIQNYYESLVIEEIAKKAEQLDLDEDVLTDVLCIALNHLPPRYIRHEVDMAYYTSPVERQEIHDKARAAVNDALDYIKKAERS